MNQLVLVILNQSIQEGIERSYRGLDAEIFDSQEGEKGLFGSASDAVVSNDGDEEVFAAFDLGFVKLIEKGFHGRESASPSELEDDGVEGVVGVVEVGVVVGGVVENLEGEIEVLLAGDDGDEAFGGEVFGPGFDWGCDCVGFEEVSFGFHGGEVVVGWVGEEGVGGGGERSSGGRDGFDVVVVTMVSEESCHVFWCFKCTVTL